MQLDGSPESLRAVEWVGDIAPVFGASVEAVAVEEPYNHSTHETSPVNWQRDSECRLAEWTAPLTNSGLAVALVSQRDLHPADGLLGVTASRQGDLLVAGVRGIGGFTGLRAGGVALKVVHRADLPIVLVSAR